MHDYELKKLLEETHPVLPGQEERAWKALKARLATPPGATGRAENSLAGRPRPPGQGGDSAKHEYGVLQ